MEFNIEYHTKPKWIERRLIKQTIKIALKMITKEKQLEKEEKKILEKAKTTIKELSQIYDIRDSEGNEVTEKLDELTLEQAIQIMEGMLKK